MTVCRKAIRTAWCNLETKTRWLLASDQVSEVEPMLEEYAKKTEPTLEEDSQNQALYRALGRIYGFAHLYPQAERWFRKVNESVPTEYRDLAVMLAHQGRHEDAVRLALSQHEDNSDPILLENLIRILAAGKPDKRVWAMTEPIWRKAEANRDDLRPPLFASAARAIQGRSDRAMQITNAMYQRYPDNILVLNNMATLMGQSEGQQDKALSIIEKAIEDAGQQPFLLDTKSVILVEMGEAQQAVDTLKHLVAIPRPDPRILFRLAVAHKELGDNGQSRNMLSRSLAAGLESEVLTDHDKRLLSDLKQLSVESAP